MPMMTSQILKSVDFKMKQKSRYLENERLFFLQIKKFINYTSRATFMAKNSFVAEVSFKKLSYTKNWIQKQFLSIQIKFYVSFVDLQLEHCTELLLHL